MFARIAALQFADRGARNAKPAHIQNRRRNFVVSEIRDSGCAAHGNVVDTGLIITEAMHDPGALMAKLSQNFGKDSGQPWVKNTDQLPRRARWIQQRSKRIKNRAHILLRQALTHLRQRAKCWMILPRK